MWSISASDEASLRRVSGALHDAYIDGPVEHDQIAGVVVVPFLQDGWADGPRVEQVQTRQTWRYREYRVTFFRGRLILRRVRGVEQPDDWDDDLMLTGLAFSPQTNQVHVFAAEPLLVTVEALDAQVEISDEPGGHVRRRIGRFTLIASDKWLDQSRQGARSTRIPL
jgi:hypothetical protein